MAKRIKIPVKIIAVIIAVAVSGYLISGFFEVTSVDFSGLESFLGQQDIPSELSEKEDAPIFQIPFGEGESVNEIEVTDPETGEPITTIDNDEIDEIEMLENGTSDGDVDDILPSESESEEQLTIQELALVADITKIATDGSIFEVTTETQFPLLALFVEDTSNIDFSEGRFEIVLKIMTDENIPITVSGQFDIQFDGQSINQQPIDIEFVGVTNGNGEAELNFVSPQGIRSDQFLLNVVQHTNLIKSTGLTNMEFKVLDLTAMVDGNDYTITDETVFEFDFFRDPNKILVTNENGEQLRVFPTDDRIQIGTVNGDAIIKACATHSRYSCTSTRTISYPMGVPTINGVTLKDSNGDVLFSSNSGMGWLIDEMITRNKTYIVEYGQITHTYVGFSATKSAGSFSFTSPESQKNYKFYCTPVVDLVPAQSQFCQTCATYDPSTLRISCNFPE